MKRSRVMWVACLAAGFLTASASAADLGEPAAELAIQSWSKGDAVTLKDGKGKNIFVVEFWATWCGPCRMSIPHLTEMQKQYKDKGVIFVGVSREDAKTVDPFVKKQGDKMDYRVAIDQDDKTTKAYMEAYEQMGIPCAYIVNKDGLVVWVGNPMSGLDQALQKVVDGKYDLAKAKLEFAAGKKLPEYFKLVSAEEKSSGADALAQTIIRDAGSNPSLMNEFAWAVLTDPRIKHRDLKAALKAATLANDGTGGKDPAIIDTYARALWDNGDKGGAVREQRKAVKLCEDPRMKADLEKTLKDYESKADKDA